MRADEQADVHLAGSVAMDHCRDVFARVSEALGSHLCRIPDGETGERSKWILFQRTIPLLRFREELDPAIVDFMHIPVPQGDPAGDRQRIAIAKRYLDDFGVATECGWGRTAPENAPGLLESHRLAAEQLAS